MGSSAMPQQVEIDKSGSSTATLEESITNYLQCTMIEIRQIKYLNNLVEQNHRDNKKIKIYTLRFKTFDATEANIARIELHRMLKKRYLQTWKLIHLPYTPQ
ncbi:DDE-type integrase/transposase/recombinase [Legionella pneumophila serogroup 1]